jgi:predicted nucleic acid-binding protein
MTENSGMPKIYFDTSIFCNAFVAKQKPKRIVTSELTLAELLGIEDPERGWARQNRFYLGLIIFSRFIDLRPVTRDILLKTGDYRRAARQGGRSVKLPDAIHVVTAINAGCRYVFTADKRFAVPYPLKTIFLDTDGVELIHKTLDA